MKFISLFSGIGGFDLGFERAGMTCVAQVEFDKRAREVLRKHWPDVAIHEDVRNVGKQNLPIVDLVCGGFPCQDLSVAGKRKGLDGERSGLWFEFYRIIGELKPRWVVIENVPGLLTSNRGRDFAVILDGLVKCGYRVSWRVLDAQYFGLAQRRKRVFIVASLGNGSSAEVLFERESSDRSTPPSREAGKAATVTSEKSTDTYSFRWNYQGYSIDLSQPLLTNHTSSGSRVYVHTQKNDPQLEAEPTIYENHSFGGYRESSIAGTLSAHMAKDATQLVANHVPLAFTWHTANRMAIGENYSPTLTVSDHTLMGVQPNPLSVRRLTPLECERLQGFPDNWTAGEPDSARYKQCGNAVAVPVIEWIGKRIIESEDA